jgi:CheY-like chemotaxis protein
MKVLIVDDNTTKQDEIVAFVNTIIKPCEIELGKSYKSGLRTTIKFKPDLILLDMSMPNFDPSEKDPKGGKTMTMAGYLILKEIRRRELNVKVIVITQHPNYEIDNVVKPLSEITEMLHNEFPNTFIDTVFYNIKENDWQENLEICIGKFLGGTNENPNC